MALDRPTEEDVDQTMETFSSKKEEDADHAMDSRSSHKNLVVNQVEHLRSATSFGPLNNLVFYLNYCSENLNCLTLIVV